MAYTNRMNTNDITKKDVVDPKRKMEAQVWVQTVLGRTISGDFFDALRDGTVLCEVLNKIKPGTCGKYKRSTIAFVARSNISLFIKGAKKFGVPNTDLFETNDLYDKQRLSAVIMCIYAVSAKSRNIPSFKGPYIGVSYANANKRHFTKAQIDKGKTFVPKLMQGAIANSPSSVNDAYGIVKNKNVSAQQISSVQSVWSSGSKAINTSNMDAYGIVKDKNSAKHSGVLSKWEMGSKPVNKTNMDAYGIVKTDKDMQSPSGVQGKWDIGAKPFNNTNMDAYGIVKTDKDMQSPSVVQSKWDIGAKPVNNTSMDAYGIVKTKDHAISPSAVQSVWSMGSKPTNTTNMDAYGIVKDPNNTTSPSTVQSVWDKGANPVNHTNMDSYGIVKIVKPS